MNFVCLQNHENVVGKALLNAFSQLSNTEVAILTNSSSGEERCLNTTDNDFKEVIKDRLRDDNLFVFNSKFVNELKEVNIDYADKVCSELNNTFKVIKVLVDSLHKTDKRGKFLFITTNPSISHLSGFPISPIYDEAIHALIRSLAKEFRSTQMAFHGICIEAVFEMIDKSELRNYRRNMKVQGLQKSPIKLEALASFIKNLSLTDLTLTSGNILYIAEGMDQMNF